jgi:tetratricopeptide (TPR) repeat protein
MTGPENGNGASRAASLSLTGGAAIVAPVSMFPNGIPNNALIVLPLSKPTDELIAMLQKGPTAVTQDQMWSLLGFNGPAVQVQDDQGRPIAIGLEDLLAGLEKHWQEASEDLNRGRIFAQELLKYSRFEKAETVLSKIVAKGGLVGDDWLALGVTQLQLKKLDKAESTLKGAQNIMKTNPYPSLHLAKVMKEKGDEVGEKAMTLRAIDIQPQAVDAWGYLFHISREKDGEEKALAAIEELANKEQNKKTAAPYIAVQGYYAEKEEGRDQAIKWAKKAVERNVDDPLALLCLSALYGQAGQLDEVIKLLQPHEGKMSRDVRLAHNYFEALFQNRQIDKVTRLLNALAGSPDKEVKQFAIERSRAVAQYLQQQQQQLQGAAQGNVSPSAPSGGARRS